MGTELTIISKIKSALVYLNKVRVGDESSIDGGYGFSDVYKVNPILNIFYDNPIPNRRFAFINCFIFSYSIYLLYFLSNLFQGTLFDDTVHFMRLENSYHFLFLLIFPSIMVMMRSIYNQLDRSFKSLEAIVKDKAEYHNRIEKWKKMMTSRRQYFLIGGLLSLSILDPIYNNIVYWGDPSYYNSAFYYPTNFLVIVLFNALGLIVIGSYIWHVITIVIILRDFCTLKLELNPLHPDGAAGLKPVTRITYRMNLLMLMCMSLPILFGFLDASSAFDSALVMSVIVATSLSIIVFVFPLTKAHRLMDERKRETLHTLSLKYQEMNELLMGDLSKKGYTFNKKAAETLDQIQKMYDQVKKMPVWPFNLNYFLRILATIIFPVLLFFGEELVKVTFYFIIGSENIAEISFF